MARMMKLTPAQRDAGAVIACFPEMKSRMAKLVPPSSLIHRSCETEILDNPDVPHQVRARCYRDLARVHRWLGNVSVIVARIQRDPRHVKRVLDIGCGDGALLEIIRQKLGVDVVGVDLTPPDWQSSIRIVRCDATRDALPEADIAVCVTMIHHLSPRELRDLIRNAARFCRRLVILDLVRHALPSVLFHAFVAPFVNPINVEDGRRSIARAFTPVELNNIVREALAGTQWTFRHDVAALYVRQVVDIQYVC
jgi:2-polyprenyl-3-methyl-5-hydroxy-6-metoxy-1,4-benzoquinol methylase